MKNLFLLLLMAVVFCGNAQAQKGMHGIGVNAAGALVGGHLSMGGGLKYQYNISNYFRIEPSFTLYSLGEELGKEEEGFDKAGLINLDIFFFKPHAIRPYLFAGVGFASGIEVDDFNNDGSIRYIGSFSDVGFNVGIGLDWRVTHAWSVQIECGALGMLAGGNMNGVKFNIGLCYNL